MKKNILFDNYIKSLDKKYNAVCFDIDGTLTKKNSKNIDERVIEIIIDLLERKIPIVFITGRGEIGLNDFKHDIFQRIKNSEKITDSDMKKIYVLANDGARLFYSNFISQEGFLRENIYVTTKEELEQLLVMNELVTKIKNKLEKKYYDITYSYDLKTFQIINVRMVFNTNDDKIINSIFDIIEKNILDKKLDGIHLTRGMYKNNSVIQIGTASKNQAIERTERLIGVPQNSMIRIGDCGDLRGNDYSMLNCNQGYSVDKTSGSYDSCFPIFDDNGNIIKGVDATIHLIKSAKILPTVALEKANKDIYKYNLARVESSIVSKKKELLQKYNGLISNNFKNCNGIDDLFDKESGSIIIPMYEMELLQNSTLKDLWLSVENNKMKYSLRDNNYFLLRGSKTYYYLLSNRTSINRKDNTTKKDVIKWYENNIKMLDDSITAIYLSNEDLNKQINKKLILGILDNCRNILLILINHYLISNNIDKNILFDISLEEINGNNKLYSTIMNIERCMSKICFEKDFIVTRNEIIEIIKNTNDVLINNMQQELNNADENDYSKKYRAYREIDNFAENYVAVSLYKENCNNRENVNACGLSYGGIELPFLAKIIDQNRIEKTLLLKFNREVSGYTNKQLLDLRNFDIRNFGGLLNSELFYNSNVDLFDDNVLTGKTLQLAINSLYDCNIGVKNICIVRYPSINRVDQMFLDNPSAVDYSLFFNYIYGLCASSPYSWKDDDWKNENGEIDYTDSLGVFDLNRKKIVECLLKNHDYNDKSEVGEYRRSIIK